MPHNEADTRVKLVDPAKIASTLINGGAISAYVAEYKLIAMALPLLPPPLALLWKY